MTAAACCRCLHTAYMPYNECVISLFEVAIMAAVICWSTWVTVEDSVLGEFKGTFPTGE